MKYRTFNKTGLTVSEIGIGTNRFGHNVDQKEVTKILSVSRFMITFQFYAFMLNHNLSVCIYIYIYLFKKISISKRLTQKLT